MAWMPIPMPDMIARGATGGLGFKTVITQAASGAELALSEWAYAQGRWNLSQALKRQLPDGTLAPSRQRHEAARNHLYMARGREHWWPFRDWTDYICRRSEGRLVQLTATTFQIAKVYGNDPTFQYVRRLTRPAVGTVQIWLNGTLQTSGFTIDYGGAQPGGIVTFSSAPSGAVLEVACEFWVPCRYDTDRVDARLVARARDGSGHYILWDNIDVVERKE